MLPLAPIVATAASAVANAAANVVSQTARPAPAEGASFAQFLEQYAANAVDTLRSGEAAAISGVQGDMPVQKVVDAVLNAERQLHTAIALRDKAVSAYQEISRMSI